MNKLEDSIYIKTLKLGFENPYGVKLKDVIENSGIYDKLKENPEFKMTFIKWFYSNFTSENIHDSVSFTGKTSKINIDKTIKNECNKTAVITGDAINKYIDYLELSDARKSSNVAKILSIISICIASLAIIIPIVFSEYFSPPKKVIIANEGYEAKYCKFKCSDCSEIPRNEMGNGEPKNNTELDSENHVSNKPKPINIHNDSKINN